MFIHFSVFYNFKILHKKLELNIKPKLVQVGNIYLTSPQWRQHYTFVRFSGIAVGLVADSRLQLTSTAFVFRSWVFLILILSDNIFRVKPDFCLRIKWSSFFASYKEIF